MASYSESYFHQSFTNDDLMTVQNANFSAFQNPHTHPALRYDHTFLQPVNLFGMQPHSFEPSYASQSCCTAIPESIAYPQEDLPSCGPSDVDRVQAIAEELSILKSQCAKILQQSGQVQQLTDAVSSLEDRVNKTEEAVPRLELLLTKLEHVESIPGIRNELAEKSRTIKSVEGYVQDLIQWSNYCKQGVEKLGTQIAGMEAKMYEEDEKSQ